MTKRQGPPCPNCGGKTYPYATSKCGEEMPVWECAKCEQDFPREVTLK